MESRGGSGVGCGDRWHGGSGEWIGDHNPAGGPVHRDPGNAGIGGGSLSGGEGSLPGAMVGALVMAFLRNGSQQMGWPNYIQEIMIGTIIVMAVAADRYRSSREKMRA